MHPQLQLDQKVTIAIERLGINGEGIGYLEGFTVFVNEALPGEVVEGRLIEKRKNYCRASLLKVLSPSPKRQAPPCPLYGECGGCQLMHLDYSSQCEMKRQRVIDALERIGKFEGLDVLPCLPSPSPLAYRNKIQVPIREEKNGLRVGFNRQNSHALVDVDFCHIHCTLGQKVYETFRRILKKSAIAAYNGISKTGELRYLIIKTAVRTNQALVVFVTSGPASKELKMAAKEIMRCCPEVKGVVQNINAVSDNVVLRDKFCTLEGNSSIQEEICGLLFKVSSSSFFQVNPSQAEKLFQKVVEFAALDGGENVLDAFCGVGTLSLILARHAKKIVGVECVAGAIDDARQNAVNNAILNADFVCCNAEHYIQQVKNVDVVVLNPPRKGCEPLLIENLGRLLPKKIIYVSCDPATLARDLAFLKNFGYKFDLIQPIDMFPQTAHVETVVRAIR